MTKTNTWLFLAGLAAALASANVPAQAKINANGAQQNGLTANALTANGHQQNALNPNAVTANAVARGGSSLSELNGVRLEGAALGR